MSPSVLHVGRKQLTVDDVLSLADGRAVPQIEPAAEVRERIRKTAQVLARRLAAGEAIYGVTTGFGDSCETAVPIELARELPVNLVRYHGCGTGELFERRESAAIVAVRLAALVRGHSGVRLELVERLCELLQHGILPAIPCEGSVGASGDLTPLSYLAAVMMGEREVLGESGLIPASIALEKAGLKPLRLAPKEGLSLMNGTSVMTALGCIAFDRSRRIARAAAAITALLSEALRGEPSHFDARIFEAKPHPGQALVARWIREQLELGASQGRTAARIQDRYSIRCAPHVLGVLVDALPGVRRTLEIEINGANDNPLIDPETGDILHGGNFYGGHIAHAMEALKTQVANAADLLDRQMALACNPATSNGLPANLVRRDRGDASAHHGFKAMQISASALTAEALKLTLPASVFSRSTENHNQDKVSMGTIAARDAMRICELTERVVAIALLAACQALELRERAPLHPRSREILSAVRAVVPANTGDRRQDCDIATIVSAMAADRLSLGHWEEP